MTQKIGKRTRTRGSETTCDVCGNATESIVFKLYKSSTNSRVRGRMDANNYTHHANVGICCVVDVGKINWHTRRERQRDAA